MNLLSGSASCDGGTSPGIGPGVGSEKGSTTSSLKSFSILSRAWVASARTRSERRSSLAARTRVSDGRRGRGPIDRQDFRDDVDDVDAADEPREDARAAAEGGRVAATAIATCISRAEKGDARRFSTFRPVRVGATHCKGAVVALSKCLTRGQMRCRHLREKPFVSVGGRHGADHAPRGGR